jgi:hypothetical protein
MCGSDVARYMTEYDGAGVAQAGLFAPIVPFKLETKVRTFQESNCALRHLGESLVYGASVAFHRMNDGLYHPPKHTSKFRSARKNPVLSISLPAIVNFCILLARYETGRSVLPGGEKLPSDTNYLTKVVRTYVESLQLLANEFYKGLIREPGDPTDSVAQLHSNTM